MASESKQYGVLVCPKCGNDSSSKEKITYRYLMWVSHEVRGKDEDTIVIEGDDSDLEFVGVGMKTTATNVPDKQPDCSHFHCGACRWNWWEDKDKDFR